MRRRTSRRGNSSGAEEDRNEEGRKVLGEDGEENPGGRRRNFKPPDLPHFHSAADTGLTDRSGADPNVETLGYSRPSLRDENKACRNRISGGALGVGGT